MGVLETNSEDTSPMIEIVCFFFQAEDGIRDHCVTGVQTCALPISHSVSRNASRNDVNVVLDDGARLVGIPRVGRLAPKSVGRVAHDCGCRTAETPEQ